MKLHSPELMSLTIPSHHSTNGKEHKKQIVKTPANTKLSLSNC